MAPQPPKTGMSLYANLLDTPESSSSASISRAPVVFKQAADAAQQDDPAAKKQQHISAASLRFQPTKRPQLPAQRLKAKQAASKPAAIPAAPAPDQQGASASGSRPAVKSTIADWTATAEDDNVNGYFGGEKRQRGGRKKRKKNYEPEVVVQNWDDIYDPTRPNSYEAYKHSEEKIREVREWKDRLYAHRLARRYSSDMDTDEEHSRPRMNKQFAPPSSFAPPPNLNAPPEESPEPELTFSEAKPQPASEVPDDPTGEDAYARRMRLSANANQTEPPAEQQPPPPPPPPQSLPTEHNAVQPQPYSAATISRPPVRYELPAAPQDLPATEAELEATLANEEDAGEEAEADEAAPRSLRPGQKGFAERLLTKYGWTKGSGLGANESGIVKPLQVKVQKQKKKPDSEGGGAATPGGPRGKIIGGARKQEEAGKFGPMSDVVVLYGMVDGLDLDAELESGELMQEIGEECGEKYGRVERVYIDRNSKDKVPVFIKFTNQLSALRAVNALEGRIFNGNAITARFFDTERFAEGIYE